MKTLGNKLGRIAKAAVCVLFGALLLTRGQDARAHLPNVLEDGELYVVADPLLSEALYGEFAAGDEFFEVKMDLQNPLAIPIEILVPRRDELSAHRPLFALVGPGLPMPSAEELALLPHPLPDGQGAVIARYEREDREVIFESFSRRVLWTNGVVAYVMPKGDMRLWVWAPEKTTGKFILGFGVEEGGQDFGNLFENWGDYAY